MFGPRTWLLVALAALAGAAHAQIVPAKSGVAAVGFPTAGQTGSVVRSGQWFPIRVDLTVEGTDVFSGELRFESIDLDGDRVTYGRNITATRKADGSPTSLTCYAVVNAASEMPPAVDVINERGESVAKLPVPPCELLLNDDLLVLDISSQQVSKLGLLMTTNWSPGQRGEGMRDFYRNVVVSNYSARNLPSDWWGLEAVDVVVWDQPNPAAVTFEQVDALVEWVRNGGQLVVGVGASWDAIRKSALGPIMPLAGEGATVELHQLDAFLGRVGWSEQTSRELDRSVVVTTAALAENAVRTMGEVGGPGGSINLVTMRPLGSGRVVATAAGLRDLSGLRVDPQKFFAAVIDLNRYTAKFKEAQAGVVQNTLGEARYLYGDLVEPIGFGTATAVRGLLAFLFVGAYIVVATLVTWWWLRRRKLTHLSWTAFAILAVVGSVLSLGTVTAMRSFSRGVQSMNIVDLEAGNRTARGVCLFGYRSPIRQRVELSLPGDGNFLRPLTRNPKSSSYYVTPARYAGVPTKARLTNVLMRATLKQAEGYWHGELDGTIRGDLTVSRATGRLEPGSWIANELSTDLEGGYLLFVDPRHPDPDVPRAAGLTVLYDRPEAMPPVPPSVNVLAVQLPAIGAGQRIAELGAAMYKGVGEEHQKWAARTGAKRSEMPDLRTLWNEQLDWVSSSLFASPLAKSVWATLLASTRNFYLHNRSADYNSVGIPLSTEGLPDLEISHWLLGGRNAGEAMLLCWSKRPGPAQVCVNGKPQEAYDGVTVYRVRLPISYVGNPPSREGREP